VYAICLIIVFIVALILVRKISIVVHDQRRQVEFRTSDKVLIVYFVWILIEICYSPIAIRSFQFLDATIRTGLNGCLKEEGGYKKCIDDLTMDSVWDIYGCTLAFNGIIFLSNFLTGYFVWTSCQYKKLACTLFQSKGSIS
jgi:hypothetical protein